MTNVTEIRRRPGLSGARVEINRNGSGAVKTAPVGTDSAVLRRLREQADWLAAHASPAVPHLIETRDDLPGYVMVRLRELPWGLVTARTLLRVVVVRLAQHVWSHSADVKLDLDAHCDKIDRLLWSYERRDGGVTMRRSLADQRDRIDWDALPIGLTHGDPTFDNVMLNDVDDVVLVDPLPATPAVSDLPCVDLGKILQSLVGWDTILYPGRVLPNASPADLRPYVPTDNEWRAAVYWCQVHLLRTLPYLPRDVYPDDIHLLIAKTRTLL